MQAKCDHSMDSLDVQQFCIKCGKSEVEILKAALEEAQAENCRLKNSITCVREANQAWKILVDHLYKKLGGLHG